MLDFLDPILLERVSICAKVSCFWNRSIPITVRAPLYLTRFSFVMCNLKNNHIELFSGTHWGKIYILDALGHIMPQLEEKFTRHSHSVAVSQISVDHPGKLE